MAGAKHKHCEHVCVSPSGDGAASGVCLVMTHCLLIVTRLRDKRKVQLLCSDTVRPLHLFCAPDACNVTVLLVQHSLSLSCAVVSLHAVSHAEVEARCSKLPVRAS